MADADDCVCVYLDPALPGSPRRIGDSSTEIDSAVEKLSVPLSPDNWIDTGYLGTNVIWILAGIGDSFGHANIKSAGEDNHASVVLKTDVPA